MRKSNRIFELDFLRGVAVLLMCLDHLAYDLYCLPFWFPDSQAPFLWEWSQFGESVAFSDWRLALHYVFATLFLLLAGIGSSLTAHPLRRTGQIALGATVLTVATVLLDLFLDLGVTILFGVLSVLAVGSLLCWLASLSGEKAGKWIALIAGVLIVAIGFSIRWYEAPSFYYFHPEALPYIVFGTFRYGADWFPIFPCAGVVLIGYFIGKTLYRNKRSLIPALRGRADWVFCPIGRYSLWIYLLHQPVLFGALALICNIFAKV